MTTESNIESIDLEETSQLISNEIPQVPVLENNFLSISNDKENDQASNVLAINEDNNEEKLIDHDSNLLTNAPQEPTASPVDETLNELKSKNQTPVFENGNSINEIDSNSLKDKDSLSSQNSNDSLNENYSDETFNNSNEYFLIESKVENTNNDTKLVENAKESSQIQNIKENAENIEKDILNEKKINLSEIKTSSTEIIGVKFEDENISLLQELAKDPNSLLLFVKQQLIQLRNTSVQRCPPEAEPLKPLNLEILSLFNQLLQIESSIHETNVKIRKIETEYFEIVGMIQRERSDKLTLLNEVQSLRKRSTQLKEAQDNIQSIIRGLGINPEKSHPLTISSNGSNGESSENLALDTTESSVNSNDQLFSDSKSELYGSL